MLSLSFKKIISSKWILYVAWLFAVLVAQNTAYAQTFNQEVRTIQVEAKHLYGIVHTFKIGEHVEMLFDSPEAAFEVVKARVQQDNAVSGWPYHAANLQPAPEGILTNGKPNDYVWDQQYNLGDGAYPEGVITTNLRCEPGWTIVTNTLTGNKNRSARCEKYIRTSDPPETCPVVPNPVYAETGIKRQVEEDYVDSKGLLSFARTWRSDKGRFVHVGHSAIIDYSWPLQPSRNCHPGFYETIGPDKNILKKAYCFPYSSGGNNEFQAHRPNGNIIIYSEVNGRIQSRADINDVLTRASDTSDGSSWTLRTKDNVIESYDANGQLLRRLFPDGRFVLFAYSDETTADLIAPRVGLLIKMNGNFNRTVKLTYNKFGNLNSVTEPSGQIIQYTYDESSGNCQDEFDVNNCQRLTSVTYPDGKVRRYHYNEGAHMDASLNREELGVPAFLTGITDENGVRFSNYKYDAQGRVISSARAGSNYLLSYDSDTRTTVTDPLGTARSYSYKDILNVKHQTAQTQPGGAGCSASFASSAYDDNGNATTKSDFNGHKTIFVYDTSRNLEIARVEGAPPASTTDVVSPGAVLPAGSRKISTQWHSDLRNPIKIAGPFRIISYIYNGDDIGGEIETCAPALAKVNERPISVVCKKTVEVTADANGAQGFSAVATGAANTWRYTYNDIGQTLSATDPNGQSTTYTYDDQGNLATITEAAGQRTTLSHYDANGRAGNLTEPNGIVTELSYSPRGWLTSESTGGEITTYDYDGVGQLTTVTLPDGSSLYYSYDDAHRLIAIADSLGNRIAYTLDLRGNRMADHIIDPDGMLTRHTSRVYDALSRLQQATGAGQ